MNKLFKKGSIVFLISLLSFGVSGCNIQLQDTNYSQNMKTNQEQEDIVNSKNKFLEKQKVKRTPVQTTEESCIILENGIIWLNDSQTPKNSTLYIKKMRAIIPDIVDSGVKNNWKSIIDTQEKIIELQEDLNKTKVKDIGNDETYKINVDFLNNVQQKEELYTQLETLCPNIKKDSIIEKDLKIDKNDENLSIFQKMDKNVNTIAKKKQNIEKLAQEINNENNF